MNAIKSILMHLDDSPACATRLRAANAIAEALDANVKALYAVLPAFMQYAMAYSAGADVAPLMQAFEQERRVRTRALFDTTVGSATAKRLSRVEWAECVGEPSHAFAREALVADLLLLGQRAEFAGTPTGVSADFNESVLIASGKPALVLPSIHEGEPIGRVVLVAWKPTREAARALSAALPFLQRAQQVHVALWSEPGADEGPGPDVEASLRRHGVTAIMHRDVARNHEVGELLLSRAADFGADLLVMGCYGHTRAREWALGGASRSVLQAMTVPVLMAH
ncbi:MAG: universal stress protein [Burkholderiaceae bacterium]